jgi:ABC-type glucose/galactose transport system permease subunit
VASRKKSASGKKASKTKVAPRKRVMSFKTALTPIYLFALINAIICWTLCWVFWDRFVFSATLFGLGCFPIVVAVSAYLYLLTHKVEQK